MPTTVMIDFGEPTPRPIIASEANFDRFLWLADFCGVPDEAARWEARAEQIMEVLA